MINPEKFKRKNNNIADSVLEFLRESILSGDFESGEELNQVKIAEQLGVSRIPVREAFRQLASEGLIMITPHKRAIVTPITPEILDEIFEIRIALECIAITHAIKNLTMNDIENLYELIEKMRNSENHYEWLKDNREFHNFLYQKSGRQTLCSLINRLRDNTERLLRKTSSSLERQKEANLEHQAIVEACEQRDIDKAKNELAYHLQSTLKGLQSKFK
jgi:DNA-binding GntR family transcriptional regulator